MDYFVGIYMHRASCGIARLVLRVLMMGPAHGHTIAHVIERESDDALTVEHGLLYPVLHSLETQGWISSFWSSTADNRRARYYRMTPAGRRRLIAQVPGREHAPVVQACLGVSIAIALSARPSAQRVDGRPTLDLTTEDRSSAGADLGIARGRVTHIFGDAGIRVVWRRRAAVAIDHTGTPCIRLVVLSGSDADEMFRGHGDVLALAIPSAGRVYAQYDRIVALARRYKTPPGWFLGVVMAHEVGHVLLPDRGHSENGLMAASLSPEAAPMFSAREAQSLRAHLHEAVTVAALDAR